MRRTARRPTSRRRPPGVRRVGALALLVAVLLAAAALLGYAAVARWLLSGPRLRAWINTSPETTRLDWDEAVSRWPGVVRLRNLTIRGHKSADAAALSRAFPPKASVTGTSG